MTIFVHEAAFVLLIVHSDFILSATTIREISILALFKRPSFHDFLLYSQLSEA